MANEIGAVPYKMKYFLRGYEPDEFRSVAPRHGWYDIGADIGITHDNTVICAIDRNIRKQVFYWRFCPGGAHNWHMNYNALEWVYKYFGYPLRVDCTGSGTTIPFEMPRRGVPLEAWGAGQEESAFTEHNKPIIMDNLASLIGGKHIELFDLKEIKDELNKIQRRPKPSGKGFTIAAPTGRNEHDDIAISLGLACMKIQPRLENTSAIESNMSLGPKSIWMTTEW